MIEIIDHQGKTIHRGKNLRIILDHARHAGVKSVRLDFNPGPVLRFIFDDGSFSDTDWMDWRVAISWLAGRRSWGKFFLYLPQAQVLYMQQFEAEAFDRLYGRRVRVETY